MQMTINRRFHAGDPVGAYWLANCEGFTVASPGGRQVATVDHGVFDPTRRETVALAVTHGRQRSLLSPEVVTAVVPATETLVVNRDTYEQLRPASTAALERAAHAVARAVSSAASELRAALEDRFRPHQR